MTWASAHPVLAIWLCILVILACCAAIVALFWPLLRSVGGRHKADPGWYLSDGEKCSNGRAKAAGPLPAELLAAPVAEDPVPAVMASLRHRYGTLGDDGPAPFEKELPLNAAARTCELPAWAQNKAPPVLTPRLAPALLVAAFLTQGLTEAKRALDATPLPEIQRQRDEAGIGDLDYAPSAPFRDWLSAETQARGIPVAEVMAAVEAEHERRVGAEQEVA